MHPDDGVPDFIRTKTWNREEEKAGLCECNGILPADLRFSDLVDVNLTGFPLLITELVF